MNKGPGWLQQPPHEGNTIYVRHIMSLQKKQKANFRTRRSKGFDGNAGWLLLKVRPHKAGSYDILYQIYEPVVKSARRFEMGIPTALGFHFFICTAIRKCPAPMVDTDVGIIF
jgi:hypothetical protein